MFGNDKIILASSSPRRKKLLLKIGLEPIKIISPNIDEKKIDTFPISKRVVEIAVKKAIHVKEKNNIKDFYILSCDNIVARAGRVYEKTNEKKKIRNYLKDLSGRKHFVYGGICLLTPSGMIHKKLVTTEVFFKRLSKNEINDEDLISDGKGKAGGYAIQNQGEKIIKKIKGSYSNVVGLSLFDISNMLLGIGWKKSE